MSDVEMASSNRDTDPIGLEPPPPEPDDAERFAGIVKNLFAENTRELTDAFKGVESLLQTTLDALLEVLASNTKLNERVTKVETLADQTKNELDDLKRLFSEHLKVCTAA